MPGWSVNRYAWMSVKLIVEFFYLDFYFQAATCLYMNIYIRAINRYARISILSTVFIFGLHSLLFSRYLFMYNMRICIRIASKINYFFHACLTITCWTCTFNKLLYWIVMCSYLLCSPFIVIIWMRKQLP